MRRGREPLADRVRGRDLRVPVRADRRPDHLQLQRLAAELRVARASRSTGIRAVRERRPARRAVGSRCRSRSSPSSASTILGSLLGLGLARLRFRGCGATETLLLLPMVTPEIIMGISLLIFFSQLFGAERVDRPDLARPHHVLHLVRGDHRPRAGGGPGPAARGGRARPGRVGVRAPSARDAAADRAGRRSPGRCSRSRCRSTTSS